MTRTKAEKMALFAGCCLGAALISGFFNMMLTVPFSAMFVGYTFLAVEMKKEEPPKKIALTPAEAQV